MTVPSLRLAPGRIPAPEDRWNDAGSAGLSSLDALVYRSNLLGSDRALANQGGGNTSSKGTAVDHSGREQRVLWVKGSGTDLASITPGGFAVLRLDEIIPTSRAPRSRRSYTRSSRPPKSTTLTPTQSSR